MQQNNKKNILYVDDEEINLSLFELTFNSLYNILTATSGNAGLEILETHQIDIVISDMKMPLMDGLTFIQKIKERRPALPCLILSGYQLTEPVRKAIASKIIIAYIMKPFKKGQLVELIEKYD